MNNKFALLAKTLVLTCLTTTIFSGEIDYRNDVLTEGLPIINSVDEKDILPGGFRMTKVVTLPTENGLNWKGIGELNMSGSSQFSELSLDALIKRIGKKHITIVNVRQEDGGFLEPEEGKGAIAFSYLMSMPWWTGENPAGNRTVEEIEASEEKKMQKITEGRVFTVYGTSDSYAPTDTHQVLYKIDMVAKRALTEKTMAAEKGLGYIRIPDKKFGNMEYAHVDQFVEFVKQLPKNEWLHFHCKKGQSRTTLFMIMYDMMRNADKATASEIIKRQGPLGLGGADLFGLPDKEDWDHSFKKGWNRFLYQFHLYVNENRSTGFQKSWSEWAEEQGLPKPEKVVLGDYYVDTTVASELPFENEPAYSDKVLVLNTINEGKLRVQNFRSTEDMWLDPTVIFNNIGLTDYQASGSNQYTKVGLGLLVSKLKQKSPNVIIVDLRHDDHLFVNGLNVSTFESKEALLEPRSPEEILESEEKLKVALIQEAKLEVHAIDTKYPKNVFDDRFILTLKPTTVETPKELVTGLGAEYLLIGSKRFSEVADDDIDRFISYVRTAPADAWYHFHCKKGKSRTTMFMILLDMMRNADKVSFEDIVRRQYEIGGINIFDVTPKDPTWTEEIESKKQWIQFLARFHKYAENNMGSNFATLWKQWSEDNQDYQPNIDHLVIIRETGTPSS